MAKDLLIVAWFLLVALSFLGVYLGIGLPGSVLQATYCAFLILSLCSIVLGVLKGAKKASKGRDIQSRVD